MVLELERIRHLAWCPELWRMLAVAVVAVVVGSVGLAEQLVVVVKSVLDIFDRLALEDVAAAHVVELIATVAAVAVELVVA